MNSSVEKNNGYESTRPIRAQRIGIKSFHIFRTKMSLITLAVFGMLLNTTSSSNTDNSSFVEVTSLPNHSEDCTSLINLALGLQINTEQPAKMGKILENCCTAGGVTCTNNLVTQIYWGSLGLTGILNGSALPPLLQQLDLPIINMVLSQNLAKYHDLFINW